MYIPYCRKYLPGEKFHQFLHLLAWVKLNFLSHIDDYTKDMATFTALVKIYSGKYFCNARVAGIGEIFVQRKVLAICEWIWEKGPLRAKNEFQVSITT